MNERQAILLVEDNESDEELTLRALKRANISNPIVVARDGAQALDFFAARGRFADRDLTALPQLVLLDLNLPKLSGVEVLKAIRADERTKVVPVVVLTSSKEDRDLDAAYRQGANSYIVKPVDFTQFTQAVHQLGLYWLVLNQRPAAS